MDKYYTEGFLIQVIIYATLWLINEYIALLLCLSLGLVFGSLLIFAFIIELIEKSKVPGSYFKWMMISCVAPLLTAAAFTLLYRGNFDWIN